MKTNKYTIKTWPSVPEEEKQLLKYKFKRLYLEKRQHYSNSPSKKMCCVELSISWPLIDRKGSDLFDFVKEVVTEYKNNNL